MENPRRQYLAFDGRNVDQSVEAGIVPVILEVARGHFDPDATAQALASCSECPPPEIETYNDVPFYSWGEDFQGNLRERRNPPAFDHLGRGGRIAVTSEYVYRTVETPGMKALIDSRRGDGQTLADVEEFRLLAQAMSGLGAYTAFFSSRTYKVSVIPDESSGLNAFLANNFPEVIDSMQAVYKKLVAEIGNSTLLLPYQAFSTGAGVDDDGPYMALALVHSDAESAEENGRRQQIRIEDALNYPELDDWRDGLEEYSFLVDGRILSATMRGDGPASMWRSLAFLWIPTPLIPHE